MTFVEAALEILKREGRPMHARDISEKAVELDLLSHVGKTPEVTMSAQISSAVTKGGDSCPIVRIRPGVFGLRSWGRNPPGPSMAVAPARPLPVKTVTPKAPARPLPAKAIAEKSAVARTPAPAADPSADVQLVSPDAVPGGATPAGPRAAGKGRSRSRSRRKKRDGRAPASEAPQSAVSVVVSPAPAPAPASAPSLPVSPVVTMSETSDFCSAVADLLRQHPHPLDSAAIAEKLNLDRRNAAKFVDALLTVDGRNLEILGQRPRFSHHRSGWGLSFRDVPGEVSALETQIHEASRRLGVIAEKQLLRRLRQLPMDRLLQVVLLFLKRSGFSEILPVRWIDPDELHLTAGDRRMSTGFNTAVIIRRDPPERQVPVSVVTSLRGELHHYNASRGLIITPGTLSEAAVKEAQIPNLSPVAFADGEALARECIRLGIGVRQRMVPVVAFDESQFQGGA